MNWCPLGSMAPYRCTLAGQGASNEMSHLQLTDDQGNHMIRYFISRDRIQTTQGRLPIEMFIVTGDVVSGWQGYIDPPRLKTIPSQMAKFISGLQQGENYGLYDVTIDTYEQSLRMWNLAIQTAKIPPAKIAKPGEVWECTGRLFDMPAGMYSVGFCSVKVPLVMYCMDTGVHRVAGQLVDSGIQLESPSDWKCHGPLAEFIAKGKA